MRWYIMESPEAKAADLVCGDTPEKAALGHFEQLDNWSSAPSDQMEPTSHTLFDIDDFYDEDQIDDLRDIDSFDLVEKLKEIRATHPEIATVQVRISHFRDAAGERSLLRALPRHGRHPCLWRNVPD